MSKHREAFEAFQTIFNYTQRKCKNCIFSIKGIKDVRDRIPYAVRDMSSVCEGFEVTE